MVLFAVFGVFGGLLSYAAHRAVDKASELGHKLIDRAHSLIDKAVDKAAATVEHALDRTEAVANRTLAKLGDFGDKALAVVDKVVAKGVEVIDSRTNQVIRTIDTNAQTALAVVDRLTGKVIERVDAKVGDVVGVIDKNVEKALAILDSNTGRVIETVGGAGDRMLQVVGGSVQVVERISNKVVDELAVGVGRSLAVIDKNTSQVITMLDTKTDRVIELLDDKLDKIVCTVDGSMQRTIFLGMFGMSSLQSLVYTFIRTIHEHVRLVTNGVLFVSVGVVVFVFWIASRDVTVVVGLLATCGLGFQAFHLTLSTHAQKLDAPKTGELEIVASLANKGIGTSTANGAESHTAQVHRDDTLKDVFEELRQLHALRDIKGIHVEEWPECTMNIRIREVYMERKLEHRDAKDSSE
ncbi:hypothetical protein DFJ73DRAFT_781416 [Zopfochytrium polystomum]|nr:hypothetical protein DFJ73DRAFT_781416 [Zopfochytrium polystomum]